MSLFSLRSAGGRPWRRAPRPAPHLASQSRGQALVEFAFVATILLVLVLAAVDFGRLFYARVTVTNAAREGAMAAAQDPGSASGVTTAATREAQNSGVTVLPADVALTCVPSCSKAYGTKVTVTVTGHFQILSALIWRIFSNQSEVAFASSATADVVIVPAAGGVPAPSAAPSVAPSAAPSVAPSAAPSVAPSAAPSVAPSAAPSVAPSPSPTPCPAPTYIGFTTSQGGWKLPVVFTSTSTPTTGSCAIGYWRWEFGDTNWDAGNVPTTSHDYGSSNKGKTFSVTLTVTTPTGETYFITQPVTTLSN